MARSVVHQLVEARGSDGYVTTKCGEKIKWAKRDPLPDEVAVWTLDVTCMSCAPSTV